MEQMTATDNFNGDTPHLIECINALLDMGAAGALVPHGIGGHARGLLSAAAARLAAIASAPQPDVVEDGDARDAARWRKLMEITDSQEASRAFGEYIDEIPERARESKFIRDYIDAAINRAQEVEGG
jgi:hypothetical protein